MGIIKATLHKQANDWAVNMGIRPRKYDSGKVSFETKFTDKQGNSRNRARVMKNGNLNNASLDIMPRSGLAITKKVIKEKKRITSKSMYSQNQPYKSEAFRDMENRTQCYQPTQRVLKDNHKKGYQDYEKWEKDLFPKDKRKYSHNTGRFE